MTAFGVKNDTSEAGVGDHILIMDNILIYVDQILITYWSYILTYIDHIYWYILIIYIDIYWLYILIYVDHILIYIDHILMYIDQILIIHKLIIYLDISRYIGKYRIDILLLCMARVQVVTSCQALNSSPLRQ